MIQTLFTDASNYGGLMDGPPSFLVIHGSGLPPEATGWQERNHLLKPGLKVSYHLYIGRDGGVYHMVPLDRIAFHAGVSEWSLWAAQARGVGWPPQEDEGAWVGLNRYSLGIALESRNLGDPYPPEQVEACRWLCERYMARYGIAPWRVLTHAMIAAPRKIDPVGWRHLPFQMSLRYSSQA